MSSLSGSGWRLCDYNLSQRRRKREACTAQPSTSQSVGTCFGKQYLRQYDQTTDGALWPATSVPVQAPVPKDKEKQKEIRFDEFLKKNPSRGLSTPFRFDILAQLANIPARITLHELLCLSKETREALRDALTYSELFLMQVIIPTKEDGASCPQMSSGTTAGALHHLHPWRHAPQGQLTRQALVLYRIH